MIIFIMNRFLFFTLFLFLCHSSFGQSNLLNAKSPQDVGKKTPEQIALDYNEPLAYPYVDDKDILWSKIVYEYIDGYEQFNYPLFYPLKDAEFKEDRKSLWRILREYIYNDTVQTINDSIQFAEATNDSIQNKNILTLYLQNYRNFNVLDPVDYRQPKEDTSSNALSLVEVGGADSNGDGIIDENDIEWLPSKNIVGYNLKGIWYFDKKYGVLNYRPIGLQPVGYTSFEPDADDTPSPFFWIWFRDIRKILHENTIFSDKNNSKRITFDQLFISRKFHTYLYRIDNVMDDRVLEDTPYINENPYLRITESQRLKEIIRNFEHDMWSN